MENHSRSKSTKAMFGRRIMAKSSKSAEAQMKAYKHCIDAEEKSVYSSARIIDNICESDIKKKYERLFATIG